MAILYDIPDKIYGCLDPHYCPGFIWDVSMELKFIYPGCKDKVELGPGWFR